MDEWMDGLVVGWLNGWMRWWLVEWMDGWISGWMDLCLFITPHLTVMINDEYKGKSQVVHIVGRFISAVSRKDIRPSPSCFRLWLRM